MPKLPKNIQKAAEEAEVQDFSAIPGGLYRVQVKEIDVSQKSGAGNAKWIFKVAVLTGPNDPENEQYTKRVLFEHCALTEDSAWKIKSIFAALGFTMDSDADELVGETCQVMVSQGEIQSGNRKGQTGNNIDSWLADTEGGDLVGAGAATGGKAGKQSKDGF